MHACMASKQNIVCSFQIGGAVHTCGKMYIRCRNNSSSGVYQDNHGRLFCGIGSIVPMSGST